MKLFALVTVGLLTCSCNRDRSAPSDGPVPSITPHAASATPSSSAKAPSVRVLGLQPVTTTSPVDRKIGDIQGTLSRFPDKIDAWIVLGRLWVRKARESSDPGYFSNADACVDVVLDLEPDNQLARGLRAQVLLNGHEFARAMDLADQALSKDPDDLVALGVRSDACLELGRFDESFKATQRMVDLKPNLPSYIRASYAQWIQGNNTDAKRIARLAIDSGRDPHDSEPGAWALVQSANIFFGEGDYEGAEAGYAVALKDFPDYPPALVGKGRVALTKGDAAKAIASLELAYKESPLVETAWLLGDARAMAGDADGAKRAYDDVVKRGRQSDHRPLSLFYSVKKRDTDEAIKLAESEKKIRGDITTEDALAWAYYRAGRFKDAKAASDRAARLGTRDAQLWFHAGAIKLALGDKSGLKQIKEALKLSPKFDVTGAAEASELLAATEKGGK